LWNNPGLPRLWQYNLHYFDWLWSLIRADSGFATARRYALDWIENHQPDRGATGWEPYPTSLRLMNWTLLFFGHWNEETHNDEKFFHLLVNSIYRQSSCLAGQLEFQVLANHLLENAVALSSVGHFFEGVDANRWGELGNRIAREQLAEQILPDGHHFERSPMYHARVCWLVDLLSKVGDDNTKHTATTQIPKMKSAMEKMCHPNGSLALFNDCANSIYSVPSKIETPLGVWSLPDSGYYGAKLAGENYIVCDCGNIGPDYQPGHAHADTFSFEWTIDGRPFITDTGTFEYANSKERRFDRSTSSHNTIQINGRNSSEVWSSFRVGKRCFPKLSRWAPGFASFELEAEHDGYSPTVCRRSFSYDISRLQLCDALEGEGELHLQSRLHFAPGVKLEIHDGGVVANLESFQVEITFQSSKPIQILRDTSRYSPEFGLAIEREVLLIQGCFAGSLQLITSMTVKR